MGVLKRQREQRKAEKLANKQTRREERRASAAQGPPAETDPAVADHAEHPETAQDHGETKTDGND